MVDYIASMCKTIILSTDTHIYHRILTENLMQYYISNKENSFPCCYYDIKMTSLAVTKKYAIYEIIKPLNVLLSCVLVSVW